jgi:phosphoribosylformylglycinamidine synthase I
MRHEDVRVIVLTGDGINCEVETAYAFSEFGVNVNIVHVADLLNQPEILDSFHILALPGGFSFGDEISSGQVLSLKLKYSLGDRLKKFIADEKLIIGICNGFQVLVKLGLLPNPLNEREMSLVHNRQHHFIDQWAGLVIPKSKCVWTKSFQLSKIDLPIRHGEGRIVFKGESKEQEKIYQRLLSNDQIALTYEDDVNGSYQKIAGVTDPTGKILGLMPHPEAAISKLLYPSGLDKSIEPGVGSLFFKNGIEHITLNF